MPIKDIDNALRELDELEKCWNNRLSFDNLRLAERYLKGELDIIITFRTASGDQFRAVFHKSGIPAGDFDYHSVDSPQDLDGRDTNPRRDDMGVLVGYVEIVNGTKTGAHALCPMMAVSLIGLEPSDEFTYFGSGTLYFFTQRGFEFLQRSPDRKPISAAYLRTLTNCFAHDVVKGGTKIVDAVTDHQGEFNWNWLKDARPEDAICSIRPIVSHNSIRIATPEIANGGLELKEVAFGPFDLGTRPGKSIRHGSY
jgi:hypothetical protein